ncbi:MAG: helix-turn-helix transcriptional regulator [Spirochaetes bacterium]|nr:helix-turn-helix transcriptional regulator [Spirochaetota bacterium]
MDKIAVSWNPLPMGNFIAIGKMRRLSTEYPAHAHAQWELVLYTKGPGRAWSGAREIPFDDGTLVANPPGIPHREHSARGYSNIAMLVHDCRLDPRTALVARDPEHRPMLALMELLDREFHLKRGGWEATCEELLGVLLHYIAAIEKAPVGQNDVSRLENLLIDNIHNPEFSVEKALKGMGRSRFHFMRVFKISTGLSPMQYLLERRVRYASNLLKTTSLTVEEIGRQAGFEDPYYFSRLFRKRAGASPLAFRKKQAVGEARGKDEPE